jgi:formylglycine-generating enzyme required for sulfatase activity
MHMQEDPPPFRAVKPDLPALPQLESVVMKALTKDRDQRYASALDFARALVSAPQPSRRGEAPVPPLPTRIVSPPGPESSQPLPSAKIVWPLEQPPPDSKGATRVNPKDGLKYVWIPPGSFQMGCSSGDTEGSDDEKPPHQVIITKGFWLGQTEVTVGAYKRFAAATGKAMPQAPRFNPRWSHEQMPIVSVSWNDAQAYCAWAGGRLPTEAEWEYAAGAGSTEARYGSLDEVAWYSANSRSQTHPVGEKRANGFGLYDMLGNVWEWVSDWYAGNYYQNSPSQNPTGLTSGTLRVLRGGSWDNVARFVRVSVRIRYNPDNGNNNYGFRCVREVPGP